MITNLVTYKWSPKYFQASDDIIFNISKMKPKNDPDNCAIRDYYTPWQGDISTPDGYHGTESPSLYILVALQGGRFIDHTVYLQSLIEEGDKMIIDSEQNKVTFVQNHPDIYNKSYYSKWIQSVYDYIYPMVQRGMSLNEIWSKLPMWMKCPNTEGYYTVVDKYGNRLKGESGFQRYLSGESGLEIELEGLPESSSWGSLGIEEDTLVFWHGHGWTYFLDPADPTINDYDGSLYFDFQWTKLELQQAVIGIIQGDILNYATTVLGKYDLDISPELHDAILNQQLTVTEANKPNISYRVAPVVDIENTETEEVTITSPTGKEETITVTKANTKFVVGKADVANSYSNEFIEYGPVNLDPAEPSEPFNP